MIGSLADRLQAARWYSVVGRTAERDLLRSALEAPTLPFNILYIFGPGGVGKTTLLHDFTRVAAELKTPAVYIDMRNIEPTPEVFVAALQRTLNSDGDPIRFLGEQPGKLLLAFDTFELAAPLELWLRTVFLPQVSANVLHVFAGREALSPAWRDDPGWGSLIQSIPLRNLSPDESREYLSKRTVPEDQLQAVLKFTRGHPLALSLIADSFAQRRDFRFEPEATLDVVTTLVERFVEEVPSPAHRAALETCALVRLTTESLLAAAFPDEDAHKLFNWLHGLSFIDAHRDGLFPHDLAREALTTDLRWRNPDWYIELHKRARVYYMSRLGPSTAQEQQRIMADYLYLHRDNPVIQPFFDWQAMGGFSMNAMQPDDYAAIKAMVTAHEGEESANVAKYWLSRKPATVLVARDYSGEIAGFVMLLPLHEIAQEGLTFDPAVESCWRYLQTHAPLRSGEAATLFRFWMAKDSYQDVSPVQTLVTINATRHYLTTPGLAFTFIPTADPDFWEPGFAYANLARLPGADFTVGGHRYGVFGSDWRALPPLAWLTMMAEREVGGEPGEYAPEAPKQLVVLSYEDFVEATRQALRDFTRPDLLRLNPLLNSRVVVNRVDLEASEAERATTLQAVLREIANAMKDLPKLHKGYRAVYHTYCQPAETQEAAAELLDMPFSTYRRHLKAGVDYIVETMWHVELQGVER